MYFSKHHQPKQNWYEIGILDDLYRQHGSLLVFLGMLCPFLSVGMYRPVYVRQDTTGIIYIILL